MLAVKKFAPEVCLRIAKRMAQNLQNFEKWGVDTRPDVISYENCEYVAELLAIEKEIFGLPRSSHDREIVLRVCGQFQASGIPELQEWAIAELTRQKSRIEQEIAQRENAMIQLLQMLEQQEVAICN